MSDSRPQILRFSRSLYLPAAVEETAAAFEELAELEVTPEPEYMHVIFHEIHPALTDRLVDEFANQVLQRTAVARRVEGVL